MYRSPFVACLLLSGCAPLQQAPLVYTSKQVFGVDFSTPSSESPSVTFNVGFKNLDAAYIPIAVSKKSEDSTNIPVTEIFASHGQGGTKNSQSVGESSGPVSVSTSASDKAQATENLSKATQAEERAAEDLNNFKEVLEAYNNYANSKTKPLTTVQSLASTLRKTLITSDASIDALQKLEKAKPLNPSDVAPAKEKLKSNLETAELTKVQARQDYERIFDDLKRDSLSVFGTFDGRFGNSNGTDLSNKLGKVFSTGVAAQNLSAGFQTSALLEKCSDLFKASENPTQKQQILDLCTLLSRPRK